MPLIGLMRQQCGRLQAAGFDAVYLDNANNVKDVLLSAQTHIFVSPEMLCNNVMADLAQVPREARLRFSHIFVDESHCTVKW